MVRLVLEVLDNNDCYFKQNQSYKVGPYQLEVGLELHLPSYPVIRISEAIYSGYNSISN